ncbi:MAG: hypothetical protein II857_09200 [Selenomonadaceae bacterium]|nr:hypothetical protein [Selenomonadaceae bacterium]
MLKFLIALMIHSTGDYIVPYTYSLSYKKFTGGLAIGQSKFFCGMLHRHLTKKFSI